MCDPGNRAERQEKMEDKQGISVTNKGKLICWPLTVTHSRDLKGKNTKKIRERN